MKITGILVYEPENKSECLETNCRVCIFKINKKECPLHGWRMQDEANKRRKPSDFERALKGNPEKSEDYRIFGRR